jgi:hypothetical protein
MTKYKNVIHITATAFLLVSRLTVYLFHLIHSLH